MAMTIPRRKMTRRRRVGKKTRREGMSRKMRMRTRKKKRNVTHRVSFVILNNGHS